MTSPDVSNDDGNEVEGKRRGEIAYRDALTGKTQQVYRYIYAHGPVRLQEIQRDVMLSPSSLDNHIQKLLRMKMIREEVGQGNVPGYVTDQEVFEEMTRIRRVATRIWTATTAFFVVFLFLLGTMLRPPIINLTYLFALVVTIFSLFICAYEALENLHEPP